MVGFSTNRRKTRFEKASATLFIFARLTENSHLSTYYLMDYFDCAKKTVENYMRWISSELNNHQLYGYEIVRDGDNYYLKCS